MLESFSVGTINTNPETGDVAVPVGDRQSMIAGAVRVLDDAGIRLVDVRRRRPSLDEVFLTLTGHHAEDEEEDAGPDGMQPVEVTP